MNLPSGISTIQVQSAEVASPARRSQFALSVLLAGITFCLPLISFGFGHGRIDTGAILLATVVVGLGLCPTVVYLNQKRRPPAPLFPLTGLFYVAAFGLPVFYVSVVDASFLPAISLDALVLTAVSLTGLIAGYYLLGDVLTTSTHPLRLPATNNPALLKPMLWLFLAAHIAGSLFPQRAAALKIDQFVIPVGYVPIGVFWSYYLRGRLSSVERLAASGAVGFLLILRFASGSIAQVYLLLLFGILVYWMERDRIPWIAVILGLILFGILNETKMEFRHLAWAEGLEARKGPIAKARLFGEIVVNRLLGDQQNPEDYGASATDTLADRVSQLSFLTLVMDQTPAIVPYWRGATYASLFYKFVPRAIWADKPVERMGYEFSRRYGLGDYANESTSFNVPWLVEMYANFGWIGTIIGMTFVGWLFALADQKLNASGMTILEQMVGLSIIFDLFYQESNFSLMVGGKLLFTVLLLAIIHFILGRPALRRATKGDAHALYRAPSASTSARL